MVYFHMQHFFRGHAVAGAVKSGVMLCLKGCRMGHSDKVSLGYVSLLINTRFRFFILE